jgi:KUP system potassium uptake protein
MGHFGKKPIRLAWLLLVLPSLVLNYFGQGALVLARPAAIEQPFFESAPGWALVPLVLLATAATIIASQAVISGAFSMTKQAVQLGFLPRIPVVHTSTHEVGQVYVPFINVSLYAAVVFLVVFFKSSDNLAAAYGIAVASTMLLTTMLMYFITHSLWKWKAFSTFVVIGPLLLVDAVFVSSNVSKVFEGGWFPLLAGGVLFTVMTTWHRGREVVVERMKTDNIPLAGLIKSLCGGSHPPPRVDGTAVFPGGVAGMTPSAFMHNLKHNRVMHGINIFMAGRTDNVPHVHDDQKVTVEDMGYGCYSVTVRNGFMEIPNVPAILLLVAKKIPDWQYEPADTSFFLARDTVLATGESKAMALWREKLFAFLGRNAAQAAEYYSLPANRVVELGGQINL